MSKAGQLIGCGKRRKPVLLFVLQKGRCAICGKPRAAVGRVTWC